MIIEAFQIGSLRSFVESTEIQLRPLTLLFGYNSAGKSVLLRALPLIAGSLRSSESAPIELGSAAVRQAAFQDLLPHSSLSAPRRLSLQLRFRLDGGNPEATTTAAWAIRDLPDLRQQVVETFRLETQGGVSFNASWVAESTPRAALSNRYSVELRGQPSCQMEIVFKGLMPAPLPRTPEIGAIATALELMRERLLCPAADVQWLTSVRRAPERLLQWRNAPPTRLDFDGGGAADILAYDELTKGPLLGVISDWYERNLGWRLRVVPLDDRYRLLLEPTLNSPVQVPLTDVGEGLVQVFPVLVAGARSRADSMNAPRILALEEPESHLHPRLHAALAEWFCELAALPDPPQVLLETHSENVLLRVQRAVAEGTLDPARVMVYWVRQTGDGRSRAEPVEFDALGQPQGNWPPGVFTEDLDQARRLVKARMERHPE